MVNILNYCRNGKPTAELGKKKTSGISEFYQRLRNAFASILLSGC